MANDTNNNPIRIDTFGADVVIATDIIRVDSIIATEVAGSAKTVTFIDKNAAVCLKFEIPSGGTIQIRGPLRFDQGMTFDDSASDVVANDTIFIFQTFGGE